MIVRRDIENRADIRELVTSFYKNVRADEMLGPIFNRAIPDSVWPSHIEKLTDFWETVVFGVTKYKGNPRAKHQSVDRRENGSITQEHFGRWLQLWFTNVNELFEGPRADGIRDRARVMSTGLFMGIVGSRNIRV